MWGGVRRLAPQLPAAFGDRCMHEFVLSGAPMKRDLGIRTTDLAKRMLESGGYNVLVASSGEEALDLLERCVEPVDLVVTDVVMAGMNGPKFAEEIFRSRPETKVLYMSGYTDDAIVRNGILEDDMSFIQKPFLPDALALKVREVLGPIAKAV